MDIHLGCASPTMKLDGGTANYSVFDLVHITHITETLEENVEVFVAK